MRSLASFLFFLLVQCDAAQALVPEQPLEAKSAAVQIRRTFHVRYVYGSTVYIDGGHDAGLVEGTELVLKQDPTKENSDKTNTAIAPGVVAKLTVISVASVSAVCQIEATSRDVAAGDVVSLPDTEVEKMVEKDTLSNTRSYPMVISFSEGDPLDEEVRNAIPRPPLPEVNQLRGRIGFDMSTIRQIGLGGTTSTLYGVVFRADFTRIFGTHWNLNGYWRGDFQPTSAAVPATLQDVINRTYLMSMDYINPDSQWIGGFGRLYVPWASSLESIDGMYAGRRITTNTLVAMFAGSTPDPSSWDYNPQQRIGGLYFNVHGGSYDGFYFASTAGAGVAMLKWSINRPFTFTENDFSFKRYFSLYHSMQIDRPTPNPGTPAAGVGVGQSLLSLRIQVHPRVALDLSDTYFRDVPTYDPALIGTGMLDKYLYQGINGGARITFPRNVVGYFSLGQSSDSTDPNNSMNTLYGVTISDIHHTGIQADARYSKFDSAFASGTYRSITVSRDLGDALRLNLQGGRYAYTSPIAATSNSNFINLLMDTNLGARLFVESAITWQRGGSLNYDQYTTTLGYRFDNRSARGAEHARHP